MVQGVRWNCVGEYMVFVKCFEKVSAPMPREDKGEWACPAAAKIGIPIVVQKCLLGISFQNRFPARNPVTYNHHHVRLTTLDLFDRSLDEGRTLQEQQALLNNRGSITVVRQDKKPLRPHDVSEMSAYFLKAFDDYKKKVTNTNGAVGCSIDAYLATLSKDKFLESYVASKDRFKDVPWVDKRTPYEV